MKGCLTGRGALDEIREHQERLLESGVLYPQAQLNLVLVF
jgi:hypothetical protein